MRIGEIETAVREGFANEELKARIINEGPVALSDVLDELKAREAARTLTGRVHELESELVVQRASNGWL
jgi:acyl-coenzyme A synthetase/AMP-(fatty) acid ligase